MSYRPESQNQRDDFLAFEKTPTSLTHFFVYPNESLVLYLSFKPVVNLYVDFSVDSSLYGSIKTLAIDILNSFDNENVGDFDLCDDCVFLDGTDITALNFSLMEEKLT